MNLTELEFICNVEILKIEYKSGLQYIKSGIQLPAKSKMEWILTENDWDALKNKEHETIINLVGPCCSNNCWTIDIEKETIDHRKPPTPDHHLINYD